jgi:hypothetical protein
MGRICSDAADEVLRASYPNAIIRPLACGLRGTWDGTHIGQLVVNLLVNCVRYGSGEALSKLSVTMDRWLFSSQTKQPIPKSALPALSDPMTSGEPSQPGGDCGRHGPWLLHLPLHYHGASRNNRR